MLKVHKSNFVYQSYLLHMLLISDPKITRVVKSVSYRDHSILDTIFIKDVYRLTCKQVRKTRIDRPYQTVS